MKPKLLKKALGHVRDVSICVSDEVVLVEALVFGGWRLHVYKIRSALYKADEDDPLINLREDFDNEVYFLKIPFFSNTEQLPLVLDDSWFGSLEVPLNQAVMDLCDWSRCNLANVRPYQLLSFVVKYFFNFLITMNDSSYLSGSRLYNNDGGCRILAEEALLIDRHCIHLLVKLHLEDSLSFPEVLKSIILVVDDVVEEVSIAEEELDLVRIDGLQLQSYVLDDLIEL